MGELDDWIEIKKKPVTMKAAQPTKTNINIRLGALQFGMLTELAQRMDMTKSGLAEQILELALSDAYTKWHGKPASDADKKRLTGVRSQQHSGTAFDMLHNSNSYGLPDGTKRFSPVFETVGLDDPLSGAPADSELPGENPTPAVPYTTSIFEPDVTNIFGSPPSTPLVPGQIGDSLRIQVPVITALPGAEEHVNAKDR